MKRGCFLRQRDIPCRLSWVLLVFALCSTAHKGYSQEQKPSEPPAPKPSATVQAALVESNQFIKNKQFNEAVEAAERAITAAKAEKDVAGDALAYRSKALALEGLSQTDDAITAWQAAASAWEHAGDGPGMIEALSSVALLLAPKQPAQTDALFDRVFALARGESKRPLAAASAMHTAARRSNGSQYKDLPVRVWVVAIEVEAKVSPDSVNLSNALNGLASAAYERGDIGKAKEYFEQSLHLRQKITPDSALVAMSLNALGNVARKQGELEKAEQYYQDALTIRQKIVPGSLDVASSLNNIGGLRFEEGDLASAAQYFRQGLELRQKLVPDSLTVAESLHRLADVMSQQEDVAGAEEYYRQALAIRQKLAPDSLDVAASLNAMGSMERRQNRLDNAAQYYQQALAIRQKLMPDSLQVAQSLNDLGGLASGQGDLAKAESYHQQALAIRQKLSPGSLSVAASLNSLGNLAAKHGDLAKSEEYHQQALQISEKVSPNSLSVAGNLSVLGNSAAQQGDFVRASQYFEQGLLLRQKLVPNSLSAAQSLYSLSLATAQIGDTEKAEQLAQQAWELVRNHALVISGDEARQAFDRFAAHYADNLIQLQLALGKPDAAFATMEQSRAQALQELLMDKHILTNITDNAHWSEYESAVASRDEKERLLSQASAQVVRAKQELAALRKANFAPDAINRAQDDVSTAVKIKEEAESAYTQARVKVDGLWSDIRKNAPRAFTPPLPFEQAQAEVPKGALFAAFYTGPHETILFLLRAGCDCKNPLSAYSLPARRRDLRILVNKLRAQIAKPHNVEDAIAASRDLYNALFPADARPLLHSATRLIVSPDGPLWEVPFAALVTNSEAAPSYLGSEKAITYAQSLTLLAQSRHDAPKFASEHRAAALVVGNPLFARTAGLTSAGLQNKVLENKTTGESPSQGRGYLCFGEREPPLPLPGTEVEARKIAALYNSVPLLGKDATKEALREHIEAADVIHLATHGCTDPTRAMSSGLLLAAPGNGAGSDADNVLQAWEIHSRFKLKAELVVLSACDTGRGEAIAGEGLIGLTRALQYAGARSIVASLWTADDQSTLTLMVAFHRNLRKGLAKDEALRRAMASVREDPHSSHPYYWAAFYLTGDPDNPSLGEPSTH